MDWPGFVNGTIHAPAVTTSDIPQIAGGTDAYGNTIAQYQFETIQIPSGTFTPNDIIQFVFIAPHRLLNNSTQIYGDIGWSDDGSAATAVSQVATTNGYRSVNVNYTGSNWANETYRVFSNIGPFLKTIPGGGQITNYYFRGGGLI